MKALLVVVFAILILAGCQSTPDDGAIQGGQTQGKECVCPAVIEPVCGSDGQTYQNACQAACAGVEARPGAC